MSTKVYVSLNAVSVSLVKSAHPKNQIKSQGLLTYSSDTIKGNNRHSLRSASNGLILEDPTCRYKVTLGDRSFRASAPKTWNALPKGIRDQTNIITFKTMLKRIYSEWHIPIFFNCTMKYNVNSLVSLLVFR